jgi:hypothetical protein
MLRARSARVQEALVHYRTGRFDKARRVRGLPLTRLMTDFGSRPYVIDWHSEREAILPFIQRTAWELPTVAIEVAPRTPAAPPARASTGASSRCGPLARCR